MSPRICKECLRDYTPSPRKRGEGSLTLTLPDDRPLAAVDRQLEDVRAAVVSGHVQLKARAAQHRRDDLGVDDLLPLVQRLDDELAVGVHHRAVAGVDPFRVAKAQ